VTREAAIDLQGSGADAVPPGPRYLTPYGFSAAFRPDPLAYTLGLARRFGDVVRIRVGPFRSYMVFHPDDVKHVLQDNHQNYVKGLIIDRTKVLIGDGLFTSEGSFWRRQRRLAQPAFHRQRSAGFATAMTDATAAMLARWDAHAGSGVPFDVAAEMNRLTLRVVGQTLFSMDLDGAAADVGRALQVALAYVDRRALLVAPSPLIVPTPQNLRFRRARRVLDRVVYDIIETRRRDGSQTSDLLSMLLQARDEETGEGMSDRQLRDEVMTFLLAGHETTAAALAWTWYLLARHPAVEARLRAEVDTVVGDRTPTVEDLPALSYTRMVVEETMRLYPPVWGIGRQTIGEDTLGGYRVPAKVVVSISPYVTHRHPACWDDPERFDPERFTPERAAGRSRFAYLPFSGGPRLCIGSEFALMEAQLVIAMVVQRYRLALVPGRVVEPEVRLTLRPRGGLPATLEHA
jgi:cytochrome P450